MGAGRSAGSSSALGSSPVLRALAALTAVMVVAACGDSGSESSADSPAEAVEIGAEALQILGTSESLTLVRDLEIDADGTVWVLDDAAPFFVGFGPDGTVVGPLGQSGGGPQEFRNPVTLVRPGGQGADGIWTYDRARHAMVRVTGGGLESAAAVGSEAVGLPNETVTPQMLLSRDAGMPGPLAWVDGGGGSVFVMYPPNDLPNGLAFWRSRIAELSLAEGSLAERWDLSELLEDPAAQYPGATDWLPVPLLAVCPDGQGWMYDPSSHTVRALAGEGTPNVAETRAFDLPPARRMPFTADRMFEVMLPRIIEEVPSDQRPPDDELREFFLVQMADVFEEFAEVFPEYHSLRCGADTALWLQNFEWDSGSGGQGWSWVRIPLDDEVGLPQVIRFPDGFVAMRFTADRAWGIVRDEFDVPSVAWVALP
ncbi:MAG: hypothetical protein EA351_03135 [Gemmatimonadales bacterium]|nr:MAG: hypothetical protein EA351_03135 [Gemmatimonadales bacterium]